MHTIDHSPTMVYESDIYDIYWYDAPKTILVLNAKATWDWSHAHKAFRHFNQIMGGRGGQTYAIIHVESVARILPPSKTIATHVRQLFAEDPSHEELTIYVGVAYYLQRFMSILLNAFAIPSESKYRFVRSMDCAMAVIAEHR